MPYDGEYEPSQYEDTDIRCACGVTFTWTVGEQKFLNGLVEQGKINEAKKPMRCPDCRAKKKAAINPSK